MGVLFTKRRGRKILRTSPLRSSKKLQAALSSLTSAEVYERSIEGHHGSVELRKGGVKGDERDGGVAPQQRGLRRVFREGGPAAAPGQGCGRGRLHGRPPRCAQDPRARGG